MYMCTSYIKAYMLSQAGCKCWYLKYQYLQPACDNRLNEFAHNVNGNALLGARNTTCWAGGLLCATRSRQHLSRMLRQHQCPASRAPPQDHAAPPASSAQPPLLPVHGTRGLPHPYRCTRMHRPLPPRACFRDQPLPLGLALGRAQQGKCQPLDGLLPAALAVAATPDLVGAVAAVP